MLDSPFLEDHHRRLAEQVVRFATAAQETFYRFVHVAVAVAVKAHEGAHVHDADNDNDG